MKNFFLLLLIITFCLIGCQSKDTTKKEKVVVKPAAKERSPFAIGEQLFKGKGNCYACHRINKKSVGPSIVTIANTYKKQQGDIISFLREKSDPIVDPENYAVMKTNFTRLRSFSDKELSLIELYMQEVSNQSVQHRNASK